MPTINSVSGPIDTADLGFTLMHEHIVMQSPGVKENFAMFDREAEMANAVQRLKEVQDRGVKTLVDLTVGNWRDIPFVKEAVAASGAQVIVATGLYWEVPYYFKAQSGRSIEHIAHLFTRDITDGIMDTGVKAGVIKCAADEPGVTPDVERILRAAAKAHRATGVPISTHTHAASEVGFKQQDIFEDEGVDLSRVVIGHSGDTEDTAYLQKLCDRGSLIGMDRFGLDLFLATPQRVATIQKMCELGYASQIVLSHDAACYFDWVDPPLREKLMPKWNYNHIPDDVLPALREAGVSEDDITAMTVGNPRRVFEAQGAY